jgi:hypothetical protein
MGMRMLRRRKIKTVMKEMISVRMSHLLVPKESGMFLLPERTKGVKK